MKTVALTLKQCRYFRDTMRDARAIALGDSEGFDKVIFSIERLGRFLEGRNGGLGTYSEKLARVASRSPLAETIPHKWRLFHTPFETLYDLVRRARNAAMHEGAYARHLTRHSVELTIVLEDALMNEFETISDYMVRAPVCAELWHPLSFVRQTMLTYSFSFLPVRLKTGGRGSWRLISDYRLARYHRGETHNGGRTHRLESTLDVAIDQGGIVLETPLVCGAGTVVSEALNKSKGLPILVSNETEDELIGIVTAFDVL